ncbi:uncharacterized protein LOC131329254 [Rhododendron vialii]|uniref:uncharacterized protein LOC131329254 n=1 Tax=Rhododendron vialii TaxID=182163 RepID=UPI00265DFDFC|nr:uncharacterized protein LOC131329254 [Rhododendron vialii]
MVVSLGPGKFYGSSLPRPRIYTDVKFSSERVDPPSPVSDPFMSWAREAHWSMGGLSFKRFRLQGRIEGNVNRLRSQREKTLKKKRDGLSAAAVKILGSDDDEEEEEKEVSPSPPPAPAVVKRRRFTGDEEEGDWKRKRLARKLGKEFDRVAAESGGGAEEETVGVRTRSRKVVEESGGGEKNLKVRKLRRVGEIEEERAKRAAERESGGGVRTSPRFAFR